MKNCQAHKLIILIAVLFALTIPSLSWADEDIFEDTIIVTPWTTGPTAVWSDGIVTNNSTLNLSGLGTVITSPTRFYSSASNGTLNIQSGTTFQINVAGAQTYSAGTFNVNSGGQFSLGAGSITGGATLNVDSGGTFILTGAGVVGAGTLGTWGGAIQNTGTNSVFNYSGSHSTTTDASYLQDTAGSKLNFSGSGSLVLNSGSSITNGSVDLSDTATLNFSNATNNTASITAGAGTTLETTGTANLTLTGGSDIDMGANVAIGSGTTWTVQAGATLNMGSISSGDIWSGNLANTGGEIFLRDRTETVGTGQNYTQTAGTLSLDNSHFTLMSGSSITGGTVDLAPIGYTPSTLIISNNVANTAAVRAITGSVLELTGTSVLNLSANTSITAAAVVIINEGTRLNVNGGTVHIDSVNDVWDGHLSKSGTGTLWLEGITKTTTTNNTYNQASGTLNLANSHLTLMSGSSITGGTVQFNPLGYETTPSTLIISNNAANTAAVLASTGAVLELTGTSILTVNGTTNITEAAVVKINTGTTLNVNGGTVHIDDANDVWAGRISTAGGILWLHDITKTTTADNTYNQTSGTLNLAYSHLTLTSGSEIRGGSVNLSPTDHASPGVTSSLIVNNNSTLNSAGITALHSGALLEVMSGSRLNLLSGTNIQEAAQVKIYEGATVNNGGGVLHIDAANDVWLGHLSMNSTMGSTTLHDITKTTTLTNTYNQTLGTLNLAYSHLTLTSGSVISGGNVNLSPTGHTTPGVTSSLTLNNNTTNTMGVIATHDGALLDVKSGSNLVLTATTNILEAAQVKINSGTNVTLEGGIMHLNYNGAASTQDIWDGNLYLTGGTLYFHDIDKSTATGNIYEQTGGTLYLQDGSDLTINSSAGRIYGTAAWVLIEDTSQLHLNNGVDNRAAIIAYGGTEVTTTNNSNLILNSGSNIFRGSYSNIASGSTWTTLSGATLNLDGVTDDWDGDLVNNGGTIVMYDVNKGTASGNAFTQTDGTLALREGSELTINVSGGAITGGWVDLQDDSYLTLQNNLATNAARVTTTAGSHLIIGDGSLATTLTLNDLTYISAGTIVDLKTNSTLNVTGASTLVHLQHDSNVNWDGSIHLTGGTLLLDDINKVTTATSTFNQTGGVLGLINDTELTLIAGSDITGGEVGIDSTSILNLDGGSLMAAATVEFYGTINVNTDGLLQLDTGDIWRGTLNLNSGGTLDLYAGYTRVIPGSVFTMDPGGKLNLISTTFNLYTGDMIRMGSAVNISGTSTLGVLGGELNLDGSVAGYDWSGNIYMGEDPYVIGSFGTTKLENITKTTTATSVYQQAGGDLTLSNSKLILGSDDSGIVGGSVLLTNNSILTIQNTVVQNTDVKVTANNTVNVNSGGTLGVGGLVTLEADSNLNVNGGNAYLTSAIWDGAISMGEGNTGGMLVLSNVTQGATSQLTTLGGELHLTHGTLILRGTDNVDATTDVFLYETTITDIQGGKLTLNTGDYWEGLIQLNGGTLDLDAGFNRPSTAGLTATTGNLNLLANSVLNLYTGDLVAYAVNLNIGAGAWLSVFGGELNMDSTDVWDGTISVTLPSGVSTSTVNFNNVTKTTTATSQFKQDAGNTTMNASTLTFTDSGSFFNGGELTLNSDSTLNLSGGAGVGNTNTTINGSTINVNTDGYLDGLNGLITIASDATVNVNGGTTYLINDIWDGAVTMTSGYLNLQNVTQGATSSLNATGGWLDLESGSLYIRTGDIVASAAQVQLREGTNTYIQGGNLTLDNVGGPSDYWGGSIDMTSGVLTFNAPTPIQDTNSRLTASGGDLNVAGGSLFLINDSYVMDLVKVDISSGAEIVVSDTSQLFLDTDDTWDGSIYNQGTTNSTGHVTLTGLTKDTTATSLYRQISGQLNLKSGATLRLLTPQSFIDGGNVDINNSSLVLHNDIQNSAMVTSTATSSNGSLLEIGDGADDTVLFLLANSNIDKNTQLVVAKGAILGIIGDNSVVNFNDNDIWAGSVFLTAATATMNYTDDIQTTDAYLYADAGTLNVGDSANTSTHLKLYGASAIYQDTTLNIYQNAKISVLGSTAQLFINAGDTWNGDVFMENGFTFIDDFTKVTSATSTYNQTGGNLILGNSTIPASLTLNADSIISGGYVQVGASGSVGSSLTVQNGTANQAETVVTDGNSFTVTGATPTTYTLTGDSWIDQGATVTLGTSSVLNITDDSIVSINTGDTWNGIVNQTSATSFLVYDGDGSTIQSTDARLYADRGALVVGSAGESNTNLFLYGDSYVAYDVDVTLQTDAMITVTDMAVLNLNNTTSALTDALLAGSMVRIQENGILNLLGTVQQANAYIYGDSGTMNIGDGTTETNLLLDGVGTLGDKASYIAKDVTLNLKEKATIWVSESAELNFNDYDLTGGDVWEGAVVMSDSNAVNKATVKLTQYYHATTTTAKYNQFDGFLWLDQSTLIIDPDSGIYGGSVLVDDGSILQVQNGDVNMSALDVVNTGTFSLLSRSLTPTDGSAYIMTGGTVAIDSSVTIDENSMLMLKGTSLSDPKVGLNVTDDWSGAIILNGGGLALYGVTINTATPSPYFSMIGNNPNWLELLDDGTGDGSIMTLADASVIDFTNGTIDIDDFSTLKLLSGSMKADKIRMSGLIDMISGAFETHYINEYYIANSATTLDMFDNAIEFGGVANHTIDIVFRSDAITEKNSDLFVINNLSTLGDPGTFHVSDWEVVGDVFGSEAPIDKVITLKVVDATTIDSGITFTSTDKEIDTALGTYTMVPNETPGFYDMVLVAYSPKAFRGPLSLMGMYLSQLTVNDLLFQHAHDNRFIGKQIAPKECGLLGNTRGVDLWIRPYGGFEKVKTNQDFDFDNTYYGAMIGADFYTDLEHGWGFMGTPYLGYIAASQKYQDMTATENGLRAGVMGTFYAGPFRTSLDLYGGFYQTSISLNTGTDKLPTNTFAGAAVKVGYDVYVDGGWSITPTVMASYTWFNKQEWETTYGSMTMSFEDSFSGFVVAPGITISYLSDSFGVDITAQYFLASGAIKAKGGNVSLPDLELKSNSFFEVGANVSIPLTETLTGYIRALYYGIDRSGVSGQVGLSWKF